jgi:hypothetical protein
LEGLNLEGNSIRKEIGRKYCYKEGNEKEILFYLILFKNKANFRQFCAKNAVNAVLEHVEQNPRIPILKYQPNLVPRVLFLRLAWAGKTLGLSCVCVCVQGRDARNSMESLCPQLLIYYAFCPPGAKMS